MAPGAKALFLQRTLDQSTLSFQLHIEVSQVIDEIITDIEECELQNTKAEFTWKFKKLEEELKFSQSREENLQQKINEQTKYISDVQTKAVQMRNTFVHEMFKLSQDLQNKENLERKIEELQKKVIKLGKVEQQLSKTQRDLAFAEQKIRDFNRHTIIQNPNKKAEPNKTPTQENHEHPFIILDDKLLLKIFSFLHAKEVLASCQICKPFFRRISILFGIDSSVLSVPPPPSYTSTQQKQSQQTAGNNQATQQTALANTKRPAPTKKPENLLDNKPILSADLADSISKKLSYNELKGIMALTERIQKLEQLIGVVQTEKEDISARLQGTENVKEFLLGKLKETETAFKNALDQIGTYSRQSACDQEVISFLDARVREAETQRDESNKHNEELQNKIVFERVSNKEQIKIYEEMIAMEKEKNNVQEIQFKNQKKILVKEVKNLRTQVVALQAERDNYKEQLQELREKVSKLGGNQSLKSNNSLFS